MMQRIALLALATLICPANASAQSPLPHGTLDIEGLPNRYARRAAVYHRHRAVHRAERLHHGLLSRSDSTEKSRKKQKTPWDRPAPTRFERTFVARLAKAFIDTIPAGGSKKWALRLKVILE